MNVALGDQRLRRFELHCLDSHSPVAINAQPARPNKQFPRKELP
jgi:hypothetical protein